jgi:hemoglobin
MNTASVESDALDRGALRQLVQAFYADVRRDPLLGPVFEPVVGGQWPRHLERMTEFWSTVMLGSKSFKGNVYARHVALAQTAAVQPEHFLRWITLWHRHTNRRFAPAIARELQRTAEGIGRNLFYGLLGEFARFVVEDGVATAYEPIVNLPPTKGPSK